MDRLREDLNIPPEVLDVIHKLFEFHCDRTGFTAGFKRNPRGYYYDHGAQRAFGYFRRGLIAGYRLAQEENQPAQPGNNQGA